MKKISIIIVTYNSENHIYDCLESIFEHNDIGLALEVIIVDNDSSHVDEMYNKLNTLYADKIVFIKNKINGGYGQGNNVGIRAAHGDIILIMNPDVRLYQPIFKKAIEQYKNPKVAMLGMTQMINTSTKGISFMAKITTGPIIGTFETYIFNKLSIYLPQRMYFSGACFFIKKSIFQQLGMFDENVFMYGEENDLHFRLRKLKSQFLIIYEKSLKYIHLTENRPLSKSTYLKMLHASFAFYDKYGMKSKYYKNREINREIKRTKLLMNIERRRNNLERVLFYTDWIQTLKTMKTA